MRPPALVVAVDGLLVATLELRRDALRDAACDTGLDTGNASAWSDVAPHAIAGMDWSDMLRAICGSDIDETLHDLTVFAAERLWRTRCASGAPLLEPAAIARCREAAERGMTVILRADSTRQSAQSLFPVLEAETLAVRTLAADDPGARNTSARDSASRSRGLRARQLASLSAELHTATRAMPSGPDCAPAKFAMYVVECEPVPESVAALPFGVTASIGWP